MLLLLAAAKPGWAIPEDPNFKTAVVIATIVYIAVMIVLLLLFQRALKKVPRTPKKPRRRKDSGSDETNLTSRSYMRRPPESGTESDPQ